MTGKVFVDSNIWIYLYCESDHKHDAAVQFISACAAGGALVVSYQVVNEVCHVLMKRGYSEHDIVHVASGIMSLCEVVDFSSETVFTASNLRERFSFSYWDSLIVAAALLSGCKTLASEDMQDGLHLDNMVIMNVL